MANTATEIARPDRSHVEISGPAQTPEFLDSAYGYPPIGARRDDRSRGRDRHGHRRSEGGSKKAVNNPEEFHVTSIIDDAVARLEQVKAPLQQDISAGGDDLF